MANLFRTSGDYIDIINEIHQYEEAGEDIPNEVLDSLTIVEEELEGASKSIFYGIKSIEGDIASGKLEIERLKTRIDTKLKVINRLKKVLTTVTLQFGTVNKSGNRKLSFSTFDMLTRATNPLVLIDTFDNIKYMKYELKLISLSHKDISKIHNILVANDVTTFHKIENATTSEPDKKEIKALLKKGAKINGAMIDKTAISITLK